MVYIHKASSASIHISGVVYVKKKALNPQQVNKVNKVIRRDSMMTC